jgi:nucleoid-associated protein YgaU
VAVAELVIPLVPAPNAQSVAEIAPPEFDIVRVNPAGGAVIAGRGPPGADIIINAGNDILAETRADEFGEWVVVPDRPLPPGPQDLGIQARLADGRVVRSQQVVTLLVPGPEAPAEERAVAVLQDREGGAAPRIMQSPLTAPAGQVGGLTLDAVQYDEAGNLVLSGKMRMGGEVRVFVDGLPIGLAEEDGAGAWQIAPDAAVDIGRHDLRLEQINAEGQLVAEIALPFMRASPAETQGLAPGEMIVQPGASLWRIARSTYGQGILYTVIYLANSNQIDDPDLIYPGQIFTLPTAQ